MFRHCTSCHRFCNHDPIPTPPTYSRDKHHVLPQRFVCVRCSAVSWGPEPTIEESA